MHIKDNKNSPHGKFHRFLFPFSSKFPDLNFAHMFSIFTHAMKPARDTNSEPGLHVVCLYSGTPPYDHRVYKTTSLLRPYSFKPNVTTIESFYYFEDPVNATTSLLRPGFYGPTVVALTGFDCTSLH